MQLAVLETLFENQGVFDIVTVYNGQMAFEEVVKSKSHPNGAFDVVVSDLDMPISNGYETCRNIIKLFEKNIPDQICSGHLKESNRVPHLVAVSSYIDNNTKKQVKEAGFD